MGNFDYAPATWVIKNYPNVAVLDSINARANYENSLQTDVEKVDYRKSPRYSATAYLNYNMIELVGQYINCAGMMYSEEDEFELAIKEENEILQDISGKRCDTSYETWMRAFEQYIINEKNFSERCPRMYKELTARLDVYQSMLN